MNLVIGAGEVGKAVAEVLVCAARDIDHHEPFPVDVLHICFPWSEDFAAQVEKYQDIYEPLVTAVHSTVPVGTCRALDACHSPVRGRHPHLAEGLRAFVKFFAGKGAHEAAEAWPGPVEVVADPETTEAGKLWELLSYGLQIAIQKEMYAWCVERCADPDIAYRLFAETYNSGYQQLGHPEFTRPIITPTPGRIGGHCVTQNTRHIDHPLAGLLLYLNDEW